MSIKATSLISRLASSVLAYLAITLCIAILWHIVIQEILMKLTSVSLIVRDGYDNPFSSILALTAFFLFLTCILYGILNFLFLKSASSTIKVSVGMIAGLAIVCILNLSAFGLPLKDPAMITELLAIMIAGGAFPVVDGMIQKWLLIRAQRSQF